MVFNTVASQVSKYMGNAVKVSDIWGGIIINAKAAPFLAKGDGVTDDTLSLQAAIDYAISVDKKEITLPAGTYVYTTLTNASGLTFVGDGVTLNGVTTLNLTSLAALEADSSQRALNVKFPFGTLLTPAVGDGVTDDTLAVRSAISYLSSKGGGTLFFPYSTGYVLRGVIVPSNIKIVGYNTPIVQKDIIYTSTTTAISASDMSMTVADASDIKVGDVLVVKSAMTDMVYVTSVDGNTVGIKVFRIHRMKSETHTGFKYAHASGAVVSVMSQVFWVTQGFGIESDTLDDTVYQGGVENSSFKGLVFEGSRDSQDTTKRTVYDGTACGAIYFYRSTRGTVRDCEFYDFYNTPVMWYGWNNIIEYTKNVTDGVGYIDITSLSVHDRDGTSGVGMHWDQRYQGHVELPLHVSTDFNISNNTFMNCWNGGVFSSAANNGNISHNKVDTFVSHGIVVYGGDLGIDVYGVVVDGNTVQNGRVGTDVLAIGEAIWVYVVNKGCSLIGNKIKNCEVGISIGTSRLVDVIGNTIQDCTNNHIRLLSVNQDITFTSNIIAVNFGYPDSKASAFAILIDSSESANENQNIRFNTNVYRLTSAYRGAQILRIIKGNDTSFFGESPTALVNFLNNTDVTSTKRPTFHSCDYRSVPGTGMSGSNSVRINMIEPTGSITFNGLPGVINYNFNELASIRSGTTGARPNGMGTGTPYFDTTLGKPIWWNGTVWKDSAGATV